MQSMFKHLSIRVNDQHKLSIIEDNMLPNYAIATSVVEIATLEQLYEYLQESRFRLC